MAPIALSHVQSGIDLDCNDCGHSASGIQQCSDICGLFRKHYICCVVFKAKEDYARKQERNSHPKRAKWQWQAELRLQSPRADMRQVRMVAPCTSPSPFVAEVAA
eukprot:CAMPEP_0171942666 /NCGR_PEP_ID=MMETSP0993-20121228/38855_1 /TAXON_ID=483369 /ORGANISM="non described non described, Strain CCMP2098" /LENGTH=104 /DNA_ID=CAMNT_0012585133 /DNA_START=104 /DNA_END=415 /DNA_ORIENTATION=-